MSTSNNASSFVNRLLTDEAYQKSFGSDEITPDAVIAKAKADGYDFNAEELEAAAKTQIDPKLLEANLSEDDLENVVGGFAFVAPLAIFGARLVGIALMGIGTGMASRGVEKLLED